MKLYKNASYSSISSASLQKKKKQTFVAEAQFAEKKASETHPITDLIYIQAFCQARPKSQLTMALSLRSRRRWRLPPEALRGRSNTREASCCYVIFLHLSSGFCHYESFLSETLNLYTTFNCVYVPTCKIYVFLTCVVLRSKSTGYMLLFIRCQFKCRA